MLLKILIGYLIIELLLTLYLFLHEPKTKYPDCYVFEDENNTKCCYTYGCKYKSCKLYQNYINNN